QRVGVDQVAVVGQRDAERRVHVERLRLVAALAAGGGIAAMGDADAAFEQRHRLRVEHVAHQAVALVHAQLAAVGRRYPGGVLAAVLEDGQAVVQLRGDLILADDSDDAAHDGLPASMLGIAGQGCERTMPLIPVLACTPAFSCSASARVMAGPTRTRVSVPLSVGTDSVKALKPRLRRRSRSARASLPEENAPTCTAKPVPAAEAGLAAGGSGLAAGASVAGFAAAVVAGGFGAGVAGFGSGFGCGPGSCFAATGSGFAGSGLAA